MYFIDGMECLGKENLHAMTIDGIHPTDIGFMNIAKYIYPTLKAVLEKGKMK